ncbi:hypothetical protein Tco_1506331 [Tanacetum coccineum]
MGLPRFLCIFDSSGDFRRRIPEATLEATFKAGIYDLVTLLVSVNASDNSFAIRCKDKIMDKDRLEKTLRSMLRICFYSNNIIENVVCFDFRNKGFEDEVELLKKMKEEVEVG